MRELTWNELDKYSFKALTTFGDLADFKKFLPRICELVAFDGKNSGTEWPTALGKIDYAEQEYRPGPEIPTFDDAERLAIMQFLFAWWMRTLVRLPLDPDDNSQDVLEAIGRATSNLWPFLDCWKTSAGLPPALHLAELINDHGADLFKSRQIKFLFWNDLPDRTEQLSAWLAGGIPSEILEVAFQNVTDVAQELEISNAHRVLQFLRASA